MGIRFDPGKVTPTHVKVDPELPFGAAVRFQPDAESQCGAESGVTAGFTIGWINSLEADVLIPSGRHRLLRV